jgi:hypothetical protein
MGAVTQTPYANAEGDGATAPFGRGSETPALLQSRDQRERSGPRDLPGTWGRHYTTQLALQVVLYGRSLRACTSCSENLARPALDR